MKFRFYFWATLGCGYLLKMVLTGLHQDIMGKDAYLASVTKHWVDSRITGPIECIMILLLLWVAGALYYVAARVDGPRIRK